MHYDKMSLCLAFFCACNNLPMPVAPHMPVVYAETISTPDYQAATRAVATGVSDDWGDIDFFMRLTEGVVDDINQVRDGIGLSTLQDASAKKIADRANGIVIPDVFKSPEEIMAITRSMFRGNNHS